MTERIAAVVENGLLRPLEPLDIPEGQEVELAVVRLIPTADEEAEDVEQFVKALRELREEAARYPDAWWDDFQLELEANRMNFEERV